MQSLAMLWYQWYAWDIASEADPVCAGVDGTCDGHGTCVRVNETSIGECQCDTGYGQVLPQHSHTTPSCIYISTCIIIIR